MVGLMAGDEQSPVGYDKTTLKLPGEKEISVDLAVALVRRPEPAAESFSDDGA